MKCPKCNYIGFEPTARCRNCGFDFSLSHGASEPAAVPDLPIRTAEPLGPMADFDLGEASRPPRPTPNTRVARRRQDPTLDPSLGVATAPPADLPLFGDLSPDDVPLVRPAPTPTAPLSVRRSTPAPTRPRTPLARRSPEPEADGLPLEVTVRAPSGPGPARATPADLGTVAAFGPRIGAAVIDWLMLIGLDLAVVYFTLRLTRLAVSEVVLLPVAPLAAFLLLLNGGYLVLFTAASGQTIGKMAFDVKVVASGSGPLTIGRSLTRVLALFVGAAAAGLGLLPALFDGARRGLHDRLADTRVVRAS